jgi:hypothetical protein
VLWAVLVPALGVQVVLASVVMPVVMRWIN